MSEPRVRDVLLGGQLAAGVQDLAVSPAIVGEQGNEIVLHGDLSWAGEGSNVWSLRRRGLRIGQGRHSLASAGRNRMPSAAERKSSAAGPARRTSCLGKP